MAITGQAKADYMRDYMRRRRDALKAGAVRPGKTDAEVEALKAENEKLKAQLAAAHAEIWTLKTLKWGHGSFGDGRYFSKAEPDAGAYLIHWHTLHKPRGGGEWRQLPIEAESFEASFSPWGKNNRRKKTQPIGTFTTYDEALAACQAHARTIIAEPF